MLIDISTLCISCKFQPTNSAENFFSFPPWLIFHPLSQTNTEYSTVSVACP